MNKITLGVAILVPSGCFQGYCCDERKGAAAGKVVLSSIIVLLWGPTYLSSQASSMRAPLKTLLTMIFEPFTYGCQQVSRRS